MEGSKSLRKGQKMLEKATNLAGDFYGTGIEIWAGFGPVWQLLRPFFHVFLGKKIS